MTHEDPIGGLHRRFDKLETSFESVQAEQHRMAVNLVAVDKRIDLVEVQIQAQQQREALVMDSINSRLDANTGLIKKLFDKFDTHTEAEAADRKRTLFWLLTTAGSVITAIGMVMFNRVFGA